MYGCSTFYGMLTKYLKSELDRPMRICDRIMKDNNLSDNGALYRDRCVKLAGRITKDPGHPLNKEFTLLPSSHQYGVSYTHR